MNQIKVELQSWMGDDRQIAEAAWTSSYTLETKELRSYDDIERIVNMLANEKHSVPFESIIFRFWIRLPVAIDRQHMTHRIASHSGMSGRYRTMPDDFLEVPEDVKNIIDKTKSNKFIDIYNTICKEANLQYNSCMTDFKAQKSAGLITNDEYKRLREFYRGMLPQHNMTERVTIMNLRSFANYYRLRSKPNAQKEIQYIAEQMYSLIQEKNICPIAFSALDKNNWII